MRLTGRLLMQLMECLLYASYGTTLMRLLEDLGASLGRLSMHFEGHVWYASWAALMHLSTLVRLEGCIWCASWVALMRR